MKTSCEIFAELGHPWNARNYQHNSAPIVRKVRNPVLGEYQEVHHVIEGYDDPPRTRWERKPVPDEQPIDARRSRALVKLVRKGRNFVTESQSEPVFHPYVGRNVPLTPEMEAQYERERWFRRQAQARALKKLCRAERVKLKRAARWGGVA